jgi:hypothetical protein
MEGKMFEHMVHIAEFPNELEAEIACGHLKSTGIEAIVLKDDAGGMFPSLQGTEGVRLLVPRDQQEKAKKVLEEHKGYKTSFEAQR